MLRELEHLSKKYQGGDLDKIIPSVSRFIAEAQERLQRFQEFTAWRPNSTDLGAARSFVASCVCHSDPRSKA